MVKYWTMFTILLLPLFPRLDAYILVNICCFEHNNTLAYYMNQCYSDALVSQTVLGHAVKTISTVQLYSEQNDIYYIPIFFSYAHKNASYILIVYNRYTTDWFHGNCCARLCFPLWEHDKKSWWYFVHVLMRQNLWDLFVIRRFLILS